MLGKPGGADLQLGLATGPVLYAWEEHPEMGELIDRKFQNLGDVERVTNKNPYPSPPLLTSYVSSFFSLGKRLRRTVICSTTHKSPGAGVCGQGEPGT